MKYVITTDIYGLVKISEFARVHAPQTQLGWWMPHTSRE